jgi:WD40 repeat protein
VFATEAEEGYPDNLVWSPDSAYLISGRSSGSGANAIQMWDATTGQRLRTFEGHTRPVNGLSWSPNGSISRHQVHKLLEYGYGMSSAGSFFAQ